MAMNKIERIDRDLQFGDIWEGGVLAGKISLGNRYGLVAQSGMFCAAGARTADAGPVGAGVFDKIVFQYAFGSLGTAFYEGAVVFPEALAGKLAVKFTSGEGSLGEDQNSGYGLV